MSATERNPIGPNVTPELIAEAAAWVTVLHGTHATEHRFAQWLKRSDSHAKAFDEATEIWEQARALPRPRRLRTYRRPSRPNFFTRHLAVGALLLVLLGAGVAFSIRDTGVATGIGEQRMLALKDGSRVILNTQTRVRVNYSKAARRIELKEGEAVRGG